MKMVSESGKYIENKQQAKPRKFLKFYSDFWSISIILLALKFT